MTVLSIRVLSAVVAAVLLSYSSAEAQWRSVPYDSANFTGQNSMIWTVEEGDQSSFRYVVNDRTMTVAVVLQNTSVAGTPDDGLFIKIPGGYRAGSWVINQAFIRKDSGSPFLEVGYAQTFPNNDKINISRPAFDSQQGSTNATYVYFTITFDVCADTPDDCS